MTTQNLSLPLSPEHVAALHREARKLRAQSYRAAFAAAGEALKMLFAPLARRLAVARERAELEAMGERELLDLGLTRSDLAPERFERLASDQTLARNQKRAANETRPANQNARRAEAA